MDVSKVTVQNWEGKPFPAFRMVNFALLFIILGFEPQDFFKEVWLPNQMKGPEISGLHEIQDRVLLKGDSMVNQNIALSKITERRIQRITQMDLSIVLDVSVHTIQNMERGRTSGRLIIQNIQLCKIFNCHHTELINYIPERRLSVLEDIVETKFLSPTRSPKVLKNIREQITRTQVQARD